MKGSSVQRILMVIGGIICLIVGGITLPLPIPTGIPLLAVGFSLLVMSSNTVRDWFHLQRVRWPTLDLHLRKVEPHLPEAMRKALSPQDPSGPQV